MRKLRLGCGCGARLEVEIESELAISSIYRKFAEDHKECPKVLLNIESRLKSIEGSLSSMTVNLRKAI